MSQRHECLLWVLSSLRTVRMSGALTFWTALYKTAHSLCFVVRPTAYGSSNMDCCKARYFCAAPAPVLVYFYWGRGLVRRLRPYSGVKYSRNFERICCPYVQGRMWGVANLETLFSHISIPLNVVWRRNGSSDVDYSEPRSFETTSTDGQTGWLTDKHVLSSLSCSVRHFVTTWDVAFSPPPRAY